MLGYYVHQLSPVLIQIGPVAIHWYGMAYVSAFLVGFFLYRWLCSNGYGEMPREAVSDFITGGAVFGVLLGGRLGWVLFYDLRGAIENPLSIFRVWEGGMSSHGGMLGLVFFTLYFARKNKLSWLGIGDNLCVVAPFGLFFGRMANFVNGELFGNPATVPWAVIFPGESVPRHPSQLYEGFLEGVVLFIILWMLRTRVRVPRGVITGAFFICYALLRIVGEIFRVPDEAWSVGVMSAGQFLSLFLIIMGGAFMLYGFTHPRFERRPETQ